MLGVRLRVEEGEDVAAVAGRVARSLGVTYVMVAPPEPVRGMSRLAGDRSLVTRLLKALPGVDIRIVADPALRSGDDPAA
jgi:hypothetical protein